MSMSERHAYQRLLGALTRRHEIIASCERILRLCGHNEVKYDGEDRFGFEMGSNLHSDHDMDLAISFDMELDPAVVADSDQDLHYLNSDNPPSQTDPQMQRWQCLQDLQTMRSGMALPETSQVPDVCCRPYISVRSRDVIRKILPSTDAIAGDVIHVPFTAREMTLLMRSAEQCFGVPDLKKLASLMPGRTVTDIRLAWLDHLLGLESDHDQIVLYQQPVRPPPTCHVHAADALSMRPKPVVRETSQGGECVRDTHWIYRLGYIHAECTFRMQMEQVLNDIVTGVTEDTSHLAVIVGMGAEGAGSSLLLDMHDLSIRSLSGHSGVVTEALFTSDGRYILTGSDDKTVCIYNSSTSAFTHSVKAPNPLVRLAQHRQEPICALASRDVRHFCRLLRSSFLISLLLVEYLESRQCLFTRFSQPKAAFHRHSFRFLFRSGEDFFTKFTYRRVPASISHIQIPASIIWFTEIGANC
uniref:Uncharacterized protein n=1 Tax=Spongospora subterranea TaxID=70186 RepID=A0A0H5QI13_9EUKA|eukprot:CRZ00961.1 hypothetical protein [Spongospora subterranea]